MGKQNGSENRQDKTTGNNGGLPDSVRRAMAILRGKETSNDDTPEIDFAAVFPRSAKVEKRKAYEATIGRMAVDEDGQEKGIFLGAGELKDRDGTLIGLFNFYAAPDDLKNSGLLWKTRLSETFNEVVKKVATLENHLGYSGFNHNVSGKDPDEALYEALRNGTYNGEWFIPPEDVLENTLYPNRDKGDLSETFEDCGSPSSFARSYWSCNERANAPPYMWGEKSAGKHLEGWGQRMFSGRRTTGKRKTFLGGGFLGGHKPRSTFMGQNIKEERKDHIKLSTRLVRVEPRP